MMPTQRALLASLLALLLPASSPWAGKVLNLDWKQLIPAGSGSVPAAHGIVQHGQLDPPVTTASDSLAPLVTSLDGMKVRIGGYMVPLGFDGFEVREFLLAPYVGACIHVPPPPPNQIIYVESAEGVNIDNPFEPVWVVGTLSTKSVTTELADVGYRIVAESVSSSVEQPTRSPLGEYMARQQQP
jgi:uncharacterized protein